MIAVTTYTSAPDALLEAARVGDRQSILNLLAANPPANPKARDARGNTPLMLAAASGHVDCVNVLIKPCGLRWVNDMGMDALMVAANAGQAQCVAALMGDGMTERVSSKQSGSHTALTLAATRGYTRLVELLIPLSNPDHQNTNRRTALILASKGGHLDCVKLLAPITNRRTTDEFGNTAFLSAIASNHTDCVSHLMQFEDLNLIGDFGWNPLMFAIWSGGHDCSPVLRPYTDIGTLSIDRKENALTLAAGMGLRKPGVLEWLMPGSGPEPLDAYHCLKAEKKARRRNFVDIADRIRAAAAAFHQKLELEKICDASDRELINQTQRSRRL